MKAQFNNARELVENMLAKDEPERLIMDELERHGVKPIIGSSQGWGSGITQPFRLYRQAFKASRLKYEPEVIAALKHGFKNNLKPSELRPLLEEAAAAAFERLSGVHRDYATKANAQIFQLPTFEEMAEVYRAVSEYRIARMMAAPVRANGINLRPDADAFLQELFQRYSSPFLIAGEMNKRGYLTVDGKRWNQSAVALELMRYHLHQLESQRITH